MFAVRWVSLSFSISVPRASATNEDIPSILPFFWDLQSFRVRWEKPLCLPTYIPTYIPTDLPTYLPPYIYTYKEGHVDGIDCVSAEYVYNT